MCLHARCMGAACALHAAPLRAPQLRLHGAPDLLRQIAERRHAADSYFEIVVGQEAQ
jgi:hypothetical protein